MNEFSVPYKVDAERFAAQRVNPLADEFTPAYVKGGATVGMGKLFQGAAAASPNEDGESRDFPGDHASYNLVLDVDRASEIRQRFIDLAATQVRAKFNQGVTDQCRLLLGRILLKKEESGASDQEYANAAVHGRSGDLEIARLVVAYFLRIQLVKKAETEESGLKPHSEQLAKVVAEVSKIAAVGDDTSAGFPVPTEIPLLKGQARHTVLNPRVDALKTEILKSSNMQRSNNLQAGAKQGGTQGPLSAVLRVFGSKIKLFTGEFAAHLGHDAFRVLLSGLEQIDLTQPQSASASLSAIEQALTAATTGDALVTVVNQFGGKA